MSPSPNWTSPVTVFHEVEMEHIAMLADDFPNHELEADMHPFVGASLNWASMSSSVGKPYTIRTSPQLTMSVPHNINDDPEPTDRRLRSHSANSPQGEGADTSNDSSESEDDSERSSAGRSSSTPEPALPGNEDPQAHPDPEDIQRRSEFNSTTTKGSSQASASFTSVSAASSISSAQFTQLSPSAVQGTMTSVRDFRRTPDFTTRMMPLKSGNGYDRPLFLHECKRDWQKMSDQGDAEPQEISAVMDYMLEQILQQAQFAFHEYPEETHISIMCHVGVYFRVVGYSRDETPRYGQPFPAGVTARSIPASIGRTWPILNAKKTDFNENFKRVWTKAKHSKEETFSTTNM